MDDEFDQIAQATAFFFQCDDDLVDVAPIAGFHHAAGCIGEQFPCQAADHQFLTLDQHVFKFDDALDLRAVGHRRGCVDEHGRNLASLVQFRVVGTQAAA